MPSGSRIWQVTKSEGVGGLAVRVRLKTFPATSPRLEELLDAGVAIASHPVECLRALAKGLGVDAPGPSEVQQWLDEWTHDVDSQALQSSTAIPEEWDVAPVTSQTLYRLARWRLPEILLETGIARGASSLCLLRAIERNGVGELHSVDVRPDVGALVPEQLHGNWRKHILDPSKARQQFMTLVASLPPIDIFFHDSDHSEKWMEFEFGVVRGGMNSASVLASDDVELNHAFMRALETGQTAAMVFDPRKVSGYAVVR